MSVTIDYWTTTKIAAGLRTRLEKAAAEFVRGRRWWAESLGFFAWPGKEGRLAGSTKFSRSDADPEDDLFMADVDMLAILEQLAAWSPAHGVDWEVQLAGEKWGAIRAGKLDAPLKKFCTQAKKSIGKPAQAAKRIAEIFAEYDDEPAEATAVPQNAKQLQARWSKTQIDTINKFIAGVDASGLMKDIPTRALPPDLLPRFEDAGALWHDLRGFPLHRCNALHVDHVDFSFCKPPKPKHKNLPAVQFVLCRCQCTDCRFIGCGNFLRCGEEYVRCDFSGAKLRGAGLDFSAFRECTFTRADLGRISTGPKTKFQKCLFDGTRFNNTEFSLTTFTDCVFRGCAWTGAYLAGIRFKGCDVRGEDFTSTDCPRTAFDERCQTDGIQLGQSGVH